VDSRVFTRGAFRGFAARRHLGDATTDQSVNIKAAHVSPRRGNVARSLATCTHNDSDVPDKTSSDTKVRREKASYI